MNNITRGWRAFEPSYFDTLRLSPSRITVSSGEAGKTNIVNIDESRVWLESAADIGNPQTITLTLDSPKPMDTLILKGINWRDFTITYNNGQTFTEGQTIDYPDGLDQAYAALIDDNNNALYDANTNSMLVVPLGSRFRSEIS